MELVDGRPLSTVLKAEHTLLADRAADIGAAVAAALAFAHKNGVVHRDVKPGNVLIDSSGNIKVADFGIARAANTTDNLTQTGAVMGTATYFSPEQAQGWGVDARSDIYSLGVVLYEMVCGKPPFTGSNPVAVATKHVSEQPPQPRSINANLSPAFESIILTCLAKDPDDRYATADDLRADLLRFRQGRAIAAGSFDDQYSDDNTTQALPRTQATRAMSVTEATTMQPVIAGEVPIEVRRRTVFYTTLLIALLATFGALLFLLARETGLIGDGTTKTVQVPNVVGSDFASAESTLKTAGFGVKRQDAPSQEDPEIVTAQDPAADQFAKKGSDITLTVSTGPERVKVPNLIGEQSDQAQDDLKGAGLTSAIVQEASTAPTGQVIKQNPAPGSEVNASSTVTLTVSSGEQATFSVPNVVGKDEADAVDTLRNDDGQFKVKTVHQSSATVDEGKVISQDPAANSDAAKGSTVTITVSSGPEQVEVPDVMGKTETQAKAALVAAGFKTNVVYVATPLDNSDDGTVVDQDPNAGTKADQGSTVTIRVADP
jgi:serine/threonine-protein kinase